MSHMPGAIFPNAYQWHDPACAKSTGKFILSKTITQVTTQDCLRKRALRMASWYIKEYSIGCELGWYHRVPSCKRLTVALHLWIYTRSMWKGTNRWTLINPAPEIDRVILHMLFFVKKVICMPDEGGFRTSIWRVGETTSWIRNQSQLCLLQKGYQPPIKNRTGSNEVCKRFSLLRGTQRL